ncbi:MULTISPECIES: OmpA family protein [Sphingomonas]|uniref:OmpA family protein n=3 Tax=Sphingomonas zeae TaxID=1646122 RepID=A0A7Y6B856_9SPHN|nr:MULTISPECIES: OmpA family protein [Sphingomonas]MBB4049465.1 OOP family OmpA-OmpF porin [Sphingomonas zeae]MDK8186771.1 OmpA family protein [Sphingomonas zeae]MDK8216435.1 OmpA family protein [Sphingomonas sp. UMB7805-LC452B]NUU48242.1 OmpA family protein [Sphingomonas zeae]
MTISKRKYRGVAPFAATAIGLSLAACQPGGKGVTNETAETLAEVNAAMIDNNMVAEAPVETKSIIRPDIEPTPTPTPRPEPIERTIPFPAKGAQPDQVGLAVLDTLVTDPTFQLGGPITLWGHSDSSGSDAANLVSSRHRAEAVRDYLVKKGTSPDRITVIAMGEARPIAPNRKLDGSDDPEGRDKNRRVDIKVDLPRPDPDAAPAAEADAPRPPER